MYILGLDVGTTGCKAAVFDTWGNVIEYSYKEYPLIYPRKGWMELNPELVFQSVLWCIKQCTSRCNGMEIKALSVSSQGEAIIPVGFDGASLANAVVTFDTRNIGEYGWFRDNFDKVETMRITGAPQHTMFSITKMLWIKNNLPDVFEKVWKFMCFGDYISYRLGSDPVIDYSMASRTMAFDIIKKDWSDAILDKCGISRGKLPETAHSGRIIGKVNKTLAVELGISTETLIVTGGHDQACCSLGAGVLESGIAMDSLGTTESIVCVSKDAVLTPEMVDMNLSCYVYVANNLYAYLTFLSCSGSVLKWLRDNFLGYGDANIYSEMDKIVEEKYQNPTGIFVLPHFSGSGTPYLDFNSKGVIAGLTLDTDRFQLYKAILEGTALETRINLECMENCNIVIDELRCIGGGSRSDVWLQIKADVTGKKITALEVPEAGCLGAAILAGIACGAFSNVEEAVEKYVKIKCEFFPHKELHEKYNDIFNRYRNVYHISKALFS